MSQPVASTPAVTPVTTQPEGQQAVNSPTSTAQTDVQLTTTSATEPRASEPRLSNQPAPNSPLKARTDHPISEGVVLLHTAPQARTQACSENLIENSFENSFNGSSQNSISESENNDVPMVNYDWVLNDPTAVDFFAAVKNLNDEIEMYEKASQALKTSNEQMDYQLGKILGPQYNETKAVMQLRHQAMFGDAYAQNKLGIMLWNGLGINKDEAAAVSWFLKAADQGSIGAMDLLVTAYKMGIGVKKDNKVATYWFLKSSQEQGEFGVLDLSRYLDLLDFIPEVLNEFKEFENLTSITISSILIDTNDFLPIAKLIRSNTTIQAINLSECLISEPAAQLLIKALENNVSLTVLNIDPMHILPPMHATIKKLLEQNIVIAELRKDVDKYFLKNSNNLPLVVLKMVIDRTIVSYIKGGLSKEATQNAIDELMMSSRL